MNRDIIRSSFIPTMQALSVAIVLAVGFSSPVNAQHEPATSSIDARFTVAAKKKKQTKKSKTRSKGKSATDIKKLRSQSDRLKREFDALRKDLQKKQSSFLTSMRRGKAKPADATTIDRLSLKRIRDAEKLDLRWITTHEKFGRKNQKSLRWERTIRRMHDKWLNQVMTIGESAKAGKSAHLSALRIMKTVVDRTSDEAKAASYRPRIARLHQLAGNHGDAVRAYLELADDPQTAQPATRIRYIKAASASQAALANWPLTPPWNEVAAGKIKATNKSQAREELKEIFNRIAQETGGVDNLENWKYDAHIGLIDWVNDQTDSALTLWLPRLNSQAKLPGAALNHRNQAGGFTLQSHKKSRQWSELEKTARQSIALGWRPRFGKSKLDAKALLGDALFEGGKSLVETGDAKTAVAKFSEFTSAYKRDKRYEEAFFLRGKAEQSAAMYTDALQTFKDFALKFPRSRFAEAAVRGGFQLATDMAEEESGLFFGQRFMRRHRNSQDHTAITQSYAMLAIGTGNYNDGINALESLASKQKSADARVAALTRILEIQTLVAPPESVLSTAKRLMRTGALPPEVKLRVYRAQIRAAVTTGNSSLIAQTKSRAWKLWNSIESMGDISQEQRDAIGEILFNFAEAEGTTATNGVFSLAVKNPTAHIQKMASRYQSLKSQYDSVCNVGRNIYCAAALFKTARLAEAFKDSIKDLEIAETLDQQTVENFRNSKISIEQTWVNDVRRSDSQARDLANQGMVASGYALAIQLGNGADLILDDRTIGGLHGYIQIDGR